MLHFALIRLDTVCTVDAERIHRVGKELRGHEKVISHNGLEHIQLEIALTCGKADGCVIAHDLHGDHGQCLALRGIYLAGHYAAAGFVCRYRQFSEAAARAGGKPAHIVGYLHEV